MTLMSPKKDGFELYEAYNQQNKIHKELSATFAVTEAECFTACANSGME